MSEKTYVQEDIDSAATQQAVYNMVLYLPLKEMKIDDGMKISDIVIKARNYVKTHNDKEVMDTVLALEQALDDKTGYPELGEAKINNLSCNMDENNDDYIENVGAENM